MSDERKPKIRPYSRRSAKLVEDADGNASWVPISCSVTRRDEDTGEIEMRYCPGMRPDDERAEQLRREGWTVIDGQNPDAGGARLELLVWIVGVIVAVCASMALAWWVGSML